MATKQLLKVEAFHYKLDSVSDDAFEKYINEDLTPKWVALIKKHDVIRYTSTITPTTFAGEFGPVLEQLRPGWKMNEANLTLTYYVRSFDEMKAILNDPDYQAKGRDTEVGWIDTSRGQLKLGWETVYIENGEVVNTTPKE
ncbi:uncharacterized protein F4822DRAFT_331212 [Hypoxylon trugodes]|uniref:uncharacterized protein n=1 Tax=Hypoxylon trugodes TaxID=326681 RepID=UPI0021A0400C|nr:uncharacterized protein F4822DRAFT_331212 [Hypoxylon trugodes]KAI1386967.1 hypothetical protein F4822DRAFT_331212 [Hypoxylon trugodes]